MRKIELLSPAGDFDCLKAAINNGADACYIGGQDFSNRAYATNFTSDELVEAIKYAHQRDVKIYVTINTMVYDDEMDSIIDYIKFLYLNDVDAVIVSDFGLIALIRNCFPELDIHVSTQFNANSIEHIKLLENYNVKRVILGRETPIEKVKEIIKSTNIEIEVFGHGALCVCQSGSCLHSSMIGQRSGNRGKCAQPCRMEYSLLENGKATSNRKYLLSMKDLMTIDNISKMAEANIASLKIEGRMKNPSYVALVTSMYREAIDKYYDGDNSKTSKENISNLEKTFSRGFTSGYIFNDQNTNMTNTFRPSHLGEKIGKVIGIKDGNVLIKLFDTLKQKDKISILNNKFEDVKMYLSKIYVNGKLVAKGFKDEVLEVPVSSHVSKDALVYRLVDDNLEKKIEQDYLNKVKRVPLKFKVFSHVGDNLALSIKDTSGHSTLVKSEYIVDKALKVPTTEKMIQEQIDKLNDTCYFAKFIDVESDGLGIIPIKYINELRREGIEKINLLREKRYIDRNEDELKYYYPSLPIKVNNKQELSVKVHTLEQLEAISFFPEIDKIYFDNMALYNKAREINNRIIPCLSRLIDSSENLNNKEYLISNYGDLFKHQNDNVSVDTYMNVANIYSLYELIKLGVNKITLSSELNKYQIEELLSKFESTFGFKAPVELITYGNIQTMITSHCFIAKEKGHNGKHCGECKSHDYSLLDRKNFEFKLTTDKDCNVTIYNSKTLCLIDYLDEIKNIGVNKIRLDFVFEDAKTTKYIVNAFINKMNNLPYDIDLFDLTYGYYLNKEKN